MAEVEPSLVDKIIVLHKSLDLGGIAHAFGGALALAFYTREPRATADINLNISVESADVLRVFHALPVSVSLAEGDAERVRREDQVRLWWGRTPVDLFFQASSFHVGVADRSVLHPFGVAELPFLSANDLAVFKALFDRPKDWLDIEAMLAAGAVDRQWVVATLESLLGDDARADRARVVGLQH